MHRSAIYTSFLFGFLLFLASPQGQADNASISLISAADFQSIIGSPISNRDEEILMQSIKGFKPSLKAPSLPPLQMQTPTDFNQDASTKTLYAIFTIPETKQQLLAPKFWSLSHLQQILPSDKFSIQSEGPGFGNGTLSVPVGFSFNLAPPTLDCKIQARWHQGGDGPRELTNLDPSWGRPFLTDYQLSSDCNMFFRGVYVINYFYEMPNGETLVLSQNTMYIKNDSIRKLQSISLFMGSPDHVLTQKVQDQMTTLIAGLRR